LSEASHPLLSVARLNYVVGDATPLTILQDISLTVREHEFVCIVGASGCGKTTLLRLVAGLLTPTTGEVAFRGTPVTGPDRALAIVFQDYAKALLPWRTVAGNVALALESRNVPRGERGAIITGLLAQVGLADRADAFPVQLSGGMQQRLQIARCLAQAPQVLLMDEPFGALDAMTRQALQDEMLRIVASEKATALFVTHDLEEAIYLGDRVVALYPNPGRVAQIFDVTLPRPRDQLTTRESPEFLSLRRQLFDFVREGEG